MRLLKWNPRYTNVLQTTLLEHGMTLIIKHHTDTSYVPISSCSARSSESYFLTVGLLSGSFTELSCPPNQPLVFSSTTQITQHLCPSWTLLSAERLDHHPVVWPVSVGSNLCLFRTNFNVLPCHKAIAKPGKAFALKSCYSHLSLCLNDLLLFIYLVNG